MPPRFFIDSPLQAGATFSLPAGAARHVQVLRLQPGAALTLFDGSGPEWDASVVRMGRSEVEVRLAAPHEVERELARPVTLAWGMPANERMDAVVEKATELGAATLQPLVCERSVLRLSGERALKKQAHWQAIAVAACEQSGRTRVPRVAPVVTLTDWLAELPSMEGGGAGDGSEKGAGTAGATRWLLSPRSAQPLHAPPDGSAVVCLSGPEGGLTEAEEAAARAAGFVSVTLGRRVLRADTAPLAVLAYLMVHAGLEQGIR
jgi:16S rRNA (uracil1498-N3)-methyltransferase